MDCLSEDEILFGLVEGVKYNFWGHEHTFVGYLFANNFLDFVTIFNGKEIYGGSLGKINKQGDLELYETIYPNGNLTITKVS
jgi:hypothetical protein